MQKSYYAEIKGRELRYRKIQKISPGVYIFQRPFLRGLFLEGLIFGGAYLRREICVSKSIRLAYSWKEFYRFFFVLLCIWGHCFQVQVPGGLYSEGSFNETFFALRFWGAYTWRDLFSEFYGMGRTKDRCMAIYNWLYNALLIINCSLFIMWDVHAIAWWPIM